MNAKRGLQFLAIPAIVLAGWVIFHATVIPTVVVTPARTGTAVLSATGNVTVLPSLDTRVVAPAQGILTKFILKEGDAVKAGDTIAEIDQGNWPYLLNENKIELERIDQRLTQGSPEDIELDKNKRSYAKNLELAKNGNFPTEILERDRRDIERAEFAGRQERSDLEYSRNKLRNKIAEITQEIERRRIKAGYDGVIMTPVALQGDLVFSGGTLCNLTSLQKMVKAEINQDDLGAVEKCMKEKKPVFVKLFSQDEHVFRGTLSQVLPIGNPTTQRFTVFITLPDLPAAVLSGQTGEATFVADEHPGATLIPRKALIDSDQCFVLVGDRLEKRKVKVGYTTLTDAEILSGVKPGDLVVSRDADLRRDKEKVSAQTK